MNDVYAWPIAKQYLAAHYYLSEERPIAISEAQRAQLGALHLHVSFGTYSSALQVPDLENCTTAERKKRISEWQKLGSISRETAMRKFIDLISSLFPNWSKFRKLFFEFELEWISMPEISLTHKTPEKGRKKSNHLKKPEKISEFRETTPTAFKKIEEMKKGRQRRTKSRLDQCEKSELFLSRRRNPKEVQKTKFPRVAVCIKQYQEQNDEFLKDFVEDLQSYRGGNLRRTSATKMPEGFAFNTFDNRKLEVAKKSFNQEMDQFRKQLIDKELNKFAEKPEIEGANEVAKNLKEKLSRIKYAVEHIQKEYEELDSQY